MNIELDAILHFCHIQVAENFHQEPLDKLSTFPWQELWSRFTPRVVFLPPEKSEVQRIVLSEGSGNPRMQSRNISDCLNPFRNLFQLSAAAGFVLYFLFTVYVWLLFFGSEQQTW